MLSENDHPTIDPKTIIEVAVDSVEDAVAAQEAGAHRIELCANLNGGGTTPSAALLELSRRYVDIPIHAMIRPRSGDFLYSNLEFETMLWDLHMAKEIGVNGVVFGLLTPNGRVDIKRCEKLMQVAGTIQTTFHRAFDLTSDPYRSLEDIIALNFDRLLTSGQQASAHEGKRLIEALVQKAGARIKIMPGAGINGMNVADIVQRTKVNEVHFTARKPVPTAMHFQREGPHMGQPGVNEELRYVFDPEKIKLIKTTLDEL